MLRRAIRGCMEFVQAAYLLGQHLGNRNCCTATDSGSEDVSGDALRAAFPETRTT
jgi:hypothetical protein